MKTKWPQPISVNDDRSSATNNLNAVVDGLILSSMVYGSRDGSRIDCRGGGLSIPRALARAKCHVLRPLLTSFPHTTCYTKKK